MPHLAGTSFHKSQLQTLSAFLNFVPEPLHLTTPQLLTFLTGFDLLLYTNLLRNSTQNFCFLEECHACFDSLESKYFCKIFRWMRCSHHLFPQCTEHIRCPLSDLASCSSSLNIAQWLEIVDYSMKCVLI